MAPDDKDFDARGEAAERLAPLLDKAAAQLTEEFRERPTPELTERQWKALVSAGPTGRTGPRGGTARFLQHAGLISRAGIWWAQTPWGEEVVRRRREAKQKGIGA